MNPLKLLTASQLHRAADIKEELTGLYRQLNALLTPPADAPAKRKRMPRWTAARRKKFIATMRARGHWK